MLEFMLLHCYKKNKKIEKIRTDKKRKDPEFQVGDPDYILYKETKYKLNKK